MPKKIEASVTDSIGDGIKWIKRQSSGACWKVPVKSECLFSTALSLYLVKDNRRSKIIDYLMSKKVWTKDLNATTVFITALIENDEKHLAKEVNQAFFKDSKESSKNLNINTSGLKFFLKMRDFSTMNVRKTATMQILYSLWFKLTPGLFWHSRTAHLYDYLPTAAVVLFSKRNTWVNKKLEEALVRALNTDGSYAGITFHTMRAAFILQQLGNEYYAKRALRWIDSVYNGNGSFRPLIYQDVYDTAWASLALTDSNQQLNSTLKWFESTKVGPGYPYYSYSYNPDPDDTSLILLLKKRINRINKEDYTSLNFILKSQNPDGGWGYLPLPALSFSFPFNIVFKYLNSFPKRLPMVGGVYFSTIDMTSRVLITLSHFKERRQVKRSIRKGVKYLLSLYKNGRFHGAFRWTDSDIYETSMALVALYKNGIRCEETASATRWILSQRLQNPEDAAHALWVLVEGGFSEERIRSIIEFLVGKQLPDGSWSPSVSFFLTAPYWDPIFSTATPLFALRLLST